MRQALLCILLALVSLSTASNCFGSLLHRSLDGTCNNLLSPTWGSANRFFAIGPEGREPYPWVDVPQVRPLPTYADAASLPPPGPRGSCRNISNKLSIRTDEDAENPNMHSNFAQFFAQFINHDFEENRFINASSRDFLPLVDYVTDVKDPTCDAVNSPPPPAPYRCNPNDRVLVLEARFSGGEYEDGKIEVFNNATSYLDLSTVYGHSIEINHKLRTFVGGRLLTGSQTITLTPPDGVPTDYFLSDTLPTFAQTGLANFDPLLNSRAPGLIWSQGDGRANENVNIGTMHLIWHREHNLNADAVLASKPHWDPVGMDEEIFQRARAITIAKYQKVIYEEFFRAEFGCHFASKLGPYHFYNPSTNADTLVAFASAAFRYGHVTMNPWTPRNHCGVKTLYNNTITDPTVVFPGLGATAPGPLSTSPPGVVAVGGGWESVIRGLVSQVSAPNFLQAPKDIRNIRIPAGVVDLVALDILRGRHNQIPNYQQLRSTWYDSLQASERNIYGSKGCPAYLKASSDEDPLPCFEKITGAGDPNASKLKELYKKIIHIDGFVGIQIEKKAPGSSFGRTAGNIITEQFRRARDGDRFFYKKLMAVGYFSPDFASEIAHTTMASVLERVFPGFVSPANPWLVDPKYLAELAASCDKTC